MFVETDSLCSTMNEMDHGVMERTISPRRISACKMIRLLAVLMSRHFTIMPLPSRRSIKRVMNHVAFGERIEERRPTALVSNRVNQLNPFLKHFETADDERAFVWL